MAKTIIFCADGTWNSPTQDENNDGIPDYTNVYKTFLAINGEFSKTNLLDEGEQEKILKDSSGKIIQIAKYIHGVGDSKNIFNKIIGGASGSGTIVRVVRGYTFISRNYEPGDRIIITGFSRGAYTARALGGLIASQGLLKNIKYTTKESREDAYKKASAAWFKYMKSNKDAGKLEKIISAISYLPGFISTLEITKNDLQPVDSILAVGVWDTVGALGIPELFGDGEKDDCFCFANHILSEKVINGFHAVALDEVRAAFTPALWEKSEFPNQKIEQVLFSGAHADVGGGYPECGLSDISLEWMIDNLSKCHIDFKKTKFNKNICEPIHHPEESSLFKYKTEPRDFSGKFIKPHESIQQRIDCFSLGSCKMAGT